MTTLIYSNASGQELDRVEITPSRVTYATGRAETFVSSYVRRYGRRATSRILRDWSNGYVSMHELG